MTEKQQRWVDNHIRNMQEQIESTWPLSESQWERVAETINQIIILSKNNQEVQKALFDFIETYDRRMKEEVRANVLKNEVTVNGGKIDAI